MSIASWGAAVRPALLVLLGVALGATLLGPVAAHVSPDTSVAPAVVTYTRSASCPGLGFLPIDDDEVFNSRDVLRRATGYVVCAIGLPTGATVTKVQITLRDSGRGSANNCGLIRNALSVASAGTAQVMALVADTDFDTGPGDLRRVTTNINHASVNNASYAYYLQCEFTSAVQDLGIYGADVIYTIPSNKG